MAEDDITSCPVCSEDYTLEGPQVPRILPCFYTLCEECVQKILKDDKFKCPNCRRNHDKEVPFVENKYVTDHLKKLKGIKRQKLGICQSHNQDITLYCSREACQKEICQMCLVKEHASHVEDFTDLKEERKTWKNKLDKEKESLNREIVDQKTVVQALKDGSKKWENDTIFRLVTQENDVSTMFHESQKKVTECAKDFQSDVTKQLELLEDLASSVQNLNGERVDEIGQGMQQISDIRKTLEESYAAEHRLQIVGLPDFQGFFKEAQNISGVEVKFTFRTESTPLELFRRDKDFGQG